VVTVKPTLNGEVGVLTGILWPVLLIFVAGIAVYVVMRKKKIRKGGPPQSAVQ
jgi:cytochrome c-type biogenesis protein CcmH/NrfF